MQKQKKTQPPDAEIPPTKEHETSNWEKILLQELSTFMETAPAISEVHKTDHVLRVWARCRQIGQTMNADQETLCAAALLHDLGRHYGLEIHGQKSAELAEPILKRLDFPPQKIPAVLDAIAKHDYTTPNTERTTPESKILYDADKMDAFGAVGIQRHILFIQQGRMRLEEVLPALKKRYDGLSLKESKKVAKKDYENIVDHFHRLVEDMDQTE